MTTVTNIALYPFKLAIGLDPPVPAMGTAYGLALIAIDKVWTYYI